MDAKAVQKSPAAAVYTPGMLVKVFDTTVNVPNPIHFCTNKVRNLTDELHARLAGRCYKGALILGNIRVLHAGPCVINDSNDAGESTIDVQFAADVREFCLWDIITGVEVRITAPVVAGHFTIGPADRPEAQPLVVLQTTRGVETLAVGLRIPVRVRKAEHPATHPAVVYGTLLTCDARANVYRLRGSLDAATAAELMGIVTAIEHELGLRTALLESGEANVSFFETIMYAYKNPAAPVAPACTNSTRAWPQGPEWRGPPPLRALEDPYVARSVPELVRTVAQSQVPAPVAGIWTRPLCFHRSSPAAAYAEAGAAATAAAAAVVAAGGLVLDEPPRVMFATILENILSNLVAIREMATGYVAPATDAAYAGLWATMRASQAPA